MQRGLGGRAPPHFRPHLRAELIALPFQFRDLRAQRALRIGRRRLVLAFRERRRLARPRERLARRAARRPRRRQGLGLGVELPLLGGWTGLYYAINYFLQLEEQADWLERLEAQATGAQLAKSLVVSSSRCGREFRVTKSSQNVF